MANKAKVTLPPIPDKRYFSIGEASHLCKVKAHVLRYWEQEFPQLKPVKRRGNRRLSRRALSLGVGAQCALLTGSWGVGECAAACGQYD